MQKILARGSERMERPEARELADLIAESLDPMMRIEHEILHQIYLRPENFAPELTMTRPDQGHGSIGHRIGEYEECDSSYLLGRFCFINNLLRLNLGSQTAVWRILRFHRADCTTWEMQWPD